MRVKAPASLKLSRRRLMEDVRSRLESDAPELLESLDPAHPGWMLLEQCAWMVENFSESLDQYPFAVVRQLAHLLGVRLRAAQPALGVVVVDPGSDGVLQMGRDPSRWRFFTPQNESHGLVEFSLVDPVAPVRRAALTSIGRIVDGELAVGAVEGQSGFVKSLRRSDAFAKEWVRFEMLTTEGDEVVAALRESVRLLRERGVTWLDCSVEQDGQEVKLTARIVPERAFGSEITADDALIGRWGMIDDTTWTPPIRVSSHRMLPPVLRGTRPVPANRQGDIAIRGVPSNLPVSSIIERDARPAPADFADALWRTLVRLQVRLGALRPTVVRGVELAETEPAWVDTAIRRSAWGLLTDAPESTVAHIALDHPSARNSAIRVAWVLPRGARPRLRAFAVDPVLGQYAEASEVRLAWDVPLPSRDGESMVRVVALDVQLPPDANGVVLTVDGRADGVFVNPLLVVNAPVVRDGRTVTVARAVPEPVTLLHEDLVDADVMRRLTGLGLSRSARAFLTQLPLAHFDVSDADPILDFNGVALDPSLGVTTINAPDSTGAARQLRRGERLELTWYRRTDAAAGNVGPGEIRLVEQAPGTRPRLTRVTNPLGTHWGADREEDNAAVQRVFGPQVQTPITPADWERLIRSELGTRAAKWQLRVWGHSERSLISHALWPPIGPEGDEAETSRLRRALTRAGPETLLVVLGPSEAPLSGEDLDWSRQVIEALVQAWSERVPMVRRVLVTPLWTLHLRSVDPVDDLVLPRFGLAGLEGELTDGRSRQTMPRATFLLNAAIATAEAM